jgi:MFS transporter, SHS family, lactate transporter
MFVLRSSGGAIAGSVSQYIGRRLTIIVFVLWAGAFIPLWILPNTFGGLSAGAFWLQFGVQGAWGVVPIQLAEMSPPGFRATFPGVTYQLGNVRMMDGFHSQRFRRLIVITHR